MLNDLELFGDKIVSVNVNNDIEEILYTSCYTPPDIETFINL